MIRGRLTLDERNLNLVKAKKLARLVAVGLIWTFGLLAPAGAAQFVVVSASNSGDSNPGDGLCSTPGMFGACSLRAAVEESNALAGTDTIVIGPGSLGVEPPQRLLLDHVIIQGAGAGATRLYRQQGTGRLFEIEEDVVATVNDLEISGFTLGATADRGAAIYNDGVLLVNRVWFHDNFAGSGCGALRNTGTASIFDSTFSGNMAGTNENGGALCVSHGGSAVITNSTFVGNSAANGGAIAITFTDSVLELYSSTLIDNVDTSPATAASAIYFGAGSVHLDKTLISGTCAFFDNPVTSNGGNLESPGDTCLIGEAGDQPNVPSGLLAAGPLGYFGGPVPTVLLSIGSPAIDPPISFASCPPHDARGLPRDGSCDVGSFERQPNDVELIFFDGFESGDLTGWGDLLVE